MLGAPGGERDSGGRRNIQTRGMRGEGSKERDVAEHVGLLRDGF